MAKKWLRYWTKDLGIWGSNPAALVMYKSSGQALNPHHPCPPSSNGYKVERKSTENVLHSPQGDEIERVSSNTRG